MYIYIYVCVPLALLNIYIYIYAHPDDVRLRAREHIPPIVQQLAMQNARRRSPSAPWPLAPLPLMPGRREHKQTQKGRYGPGRQL